MKTISVVDTGNSYTKMTDRPNQGCSRRKTQKAISNIRQNHKKTPHKNE